MIAVVCAIMLIGARPAPAINPTIFESPLLPVRSTIVEGLRQGLGEQAYVTFAEWLVDARPEYRRLGAEGLAASVAKGNEKAHQLLETALAETDPVVKAAIALALGTVAGPGAGDVLVTTYKFDDGADPGLTLAYLRAIERCGQPGVDRLLGLATSGNDNDRSAAVAAFLQMRSPAAFQALPELVGDPHLKGDDRVSLVRSIDRVTLEPKAVQAWRDLLLGHPKFDAETQKAILDLLARHKSLGGVELINFLTSQLDGNAATACYGIRLGKLNDAAPILVQAIDSEKRTEADRVVILQALRALDDRTALPLVKKILEGMGSAELQGEALMTLAVFDPPTGLKLAIEVVDGARPDLIPAAVRVLGKSPEWAKKLGERYRAKQLPETVRGAVIEVLDQHARDNEEINNLLKTILK